jgi:uncharacterized protein (TIGR00251 family)
VTNDLYTVDDDGLAVLTVHVQPGAGRTEIVGRHGDSLKVRVAAPPDRGRANEAVAKVLADAFGLAVAKVELISGATNRSKRYRVHDLDPDTVEATLRRLVDRDGAPTRRSGAVGPPRPS